MNGTPNTAAVISFPDPLAQETAAVQQFASRLCCVAFETILGMRPIAQLQPLVSAEVATRINARMVLTCNAMSHSGTQGNLALKHLHANVRVVRALPCRVSAGVYEVSVVLAEKLRHRAVALRVEAYRGKWRATCMEIG